MPPFRWSVITQEVLLQVDQLVAVLLQHRQGCVQLPVDAPLDGITNLADVALCLAAQLRQLLCRVQPDTQEEQDYLNLYEQDLKGLRDGDPLKELLPAILTMAKEMHRADIYIGDLVQEGNMGLMLAMEDHADETEALLSMAKESMQALLESQEETKKQDNRMVEKVNDLDEQIKKLSDELGRKVSVDELEEFAGITEDEISNILKLAGEELPPEEK